MSACRWSRWIQIESSIIWQQLTAKGWRAALLSHDHFSLLQEFCRKAVLSPSSKASVLSSIWLVKVCSPVSALLSSRQSEAWSWELALAVASLHIFPLSFQPKLEALAFRCGRLCQILRFLLNFAQSKWWEKTHEALVRFTTQFVPIRGPRFHPALVLWVP